MHQYLTLSKTFIKLNIHTAMMKFMTIEPTASMALCMATDS